jgi:hypothetical protein
MVSLSGTTSKHLPVTVMERNQSNAHALSQSFPEKENRNFVVSYQAYRASRCFLTLIPADRPRVSEVVEKEKGGGCSPPARAKPIQVICLYLPAE